MKYIKRFILPIIIALSLSLSFTISCFADNDFLDYTTVKTPTNAYLNGIPFFNSNTKFGVVSNYIYDILENNSNKLIHFIPVCYFNNKVYLPVTNNPRNDEETYQYLLYNNGSKYTSNNVTYYGYSYVRLAGHGGGGSTAIGKNSRLFSEQYTNADFLYCNKNTDDSLTFDIKYPNGCNNGTISYGISTSFTCKKFAYVNDTGSIDYKEGTTLYDDIFNTSNIYWCCIVRDYKGGVPSTTEFLDLLSLFNLFSENPNGITTDDYGLDPVAIFPRYPTQTTDKSGFYYDDLSSTQIMFYVKDYGKKHKYSLKISSPHYLSNRSTYKTDFGIHYDLPKYTWINNQFISNFAAAGFHEPASKFLSKWQNNQLIFDNIMTVNLPCLDFSRVDNGARVTSCSFSLSSFITSEDTQFFNFSVIDDITGTCVGSVAVMTSKGSVYSPSSYPVKTMSWSIDNIDDSLPSGSDFTNSSDFGNANTGLCYTPTVDSDPDALGGSSSNYDGSDYDYSEYNGNDINFNVDISSLGSAFGSALNATRQFFALCVGLIPASILALVVGSVGLLLVLRILGR